MRLSPGAPILPTLLLLGLVCGGCEGADRGSSVDAAPSDEGGATDAGPGTDAVYRDTAHEDRRPAEIDGDVEEPLSCIGLPVFDLSGAAPSGPDEVTAWFDTRDAPLRAVSLTPSPCAVHRGRAAVLRYMPVADGPVLLELVEADGLTVEVFADCASGATFLGCAERQTGWTPPLRAGRPVLLVVTRSQFPGGTTQDPREWSTPVHGGLTIVRPEVLAEGASCVGLRRDRRQSCGAGLVCREGVCARARARYCRSAEPRCDAGGVCSSGVCIYPSEERGRCGDHSDCATGLRCFTDADGAARCRRALAEGEGCGNENPPFGACADGLSCLGGRCRALGRSGDVCWTERRCEAGLQCLGGICTPRQAAAHGVCDPSDLSGCPQGWGCLDGRCVDGVPRLGEACRSLFDPCAQGARCDGRTCYDARRAHGTCSHWEDCALWEQCDEGRCVVAGARGGWCRESRPSCDEGLRCVAGRCRGESDCDDAQRSGAPCGEGRSCSSAEYAGAPVTCVADGGLRGRCRGDADAVSRGECDGALRCVGGFCVRAIAAGDYCSETSTCVRGYSCGSGRRCVPNGSLGASCRVVAGQRACDPGLRCVWGLCRLATAGAGESCSTFVPRGEWSEPTCRPGYECVRGGCVRAGEPGTSCGPAAPCGAGLLCRYAQRGRWSDGNIDWSWRCVAVRREGESCGDGYQPVACDDGLACDSSGRCASRSSHCRPSEPRCPQGQRCVTHIRYTRWEGLHAHTVNDAYCAAGQPVWSHVDYDICAPGLLRRFDDRSGFHLCFPTGGMGMPCRPSDQGCDAPLRCVRGTCGIAAAEGEACNASTTDARRCLPDLDCVVGTCRRWGTDGATCRLSGAPCDAGLSCLNGRCRATPASGASCPVLYAPCGEGDVCTPTPGSQPRCLREGALGGSCRYARSPLCDEGLRCARGICVTNP